MAGAFVVSLGGEPVLYVERGGRSLVPLRDPDGEWLRPALAALVRHVKAGGAKRLAIERFDGEPVVDTDAMELLVEAGFLAGPRRAVCAPEPPPLRSEPRDDLCCGELAPHGEVHAGVEAAPLRIVEHCAAGPS